MGFHTFPSDRADALEDPARYRFCSREELLEMLDLQSDGVVADLGSGTGFYSREVAPFTGTLYAVDIQAEMHDRHRKEGALKNVELIAARVGSLPLEDDELDGAFSVMTHHEYADNDTLEEIARVIRSGGRLVTVDWSATGMGEDGPAIDERFGPSDVTAQLERAGFTVECVRDRPETLAIVGRRE